MPQARLTVTLPEGTWIRELTERYPDATFRVLAAMPDGELGVGLVEIRTPALREVVSDLASYGTVDGVEPLRAAEEEALVQFETTEPLLLVSARASGVPLEPPVDVVDGRATFDVTATRDRLARLDDELRALGMSTDLEYLYTTGDGEPLLTDRQRELLEAAASAGYYETPRECTLTELADRLGVAKSSLSETLHRAEGRVVRDYVSPSGSPTSPSAR
jgi:hypothetical protein